MSSLAPLTPLAPLRPPWPLIVVLTLGWLAHRDWRRAPTLVDPGLRRLHRRRARALAASALAVGLAPLALAAWLARAPQAWPAAPLSVLLLVALPLGAAGLDTLLIEGRHQLRRVQAATAPRERTSPDRPSGA